LPGDKRHEPNRGAGHEFTGLNSAEAVPTT
jgi:hypothetical protein